MTLLLVDTGTLDREMLRSHLAIRHGSSITLTTVRTLAAIEPALSGEPFFDAVVLASLPDELAIPDVIERILAREPMAQVIVVAGTSYVELSSSGIDSPRVHFLPAHQMARLPYMLQQRTAQQYRERRALDPFPKILETVDDVDRVIASLTSDYVYIALLNADGSVPIQYRSDSLVELSGYSHQEIDEGGSELLLHPEDRHMLAARRNAFRRGETRVDEFRIVTRDGRTIWVRDYARTIQPSDPASPEIVVGAAQDITNEKLYQSRLALQASILEMIARGERYPIVLKALSAVVEEQIPDAICSVQLLDSEANVLRPEIGGRLPPEFLDELRSWPIGPEHGACGSAAFYQELTLVVDVADDPRFERYQDLTAQNGIGAVWSTPIFNSGSDVVGTFALYFGSPRTPADHEIALLESAAQIAGIALDVSEGEVQRRLAQARYQTLVEQTPAITLIADPDDLCHITYLSPQFELFSDIPASEILNNADRVRSFVHPDDRLAFEQGVQHSLQTGEPLDIEFRIRRVSGAIAWLQATVSLVRDSQGRPLHWLGVMLDVTERNEAIRQKMNSDRRYRSLFDENLNIIVLYDYEGNVIDVNPAGERLSGYTADEIIGGPLLWMVAPEDRERAERYFLQAREGISAQFSITLIGKQGDRIELSASHSPVIVDGEIVGVSGVAEDITDRRRLESQLLHQAYHDALTGLPNRTYFDYMLSSAIESIGHDQELAVLFMDLNNFKVINDSLGHDLGDKYLSAIAGLLQDTVPENTFVARFGGDEFTVLIPASPDSLNNAMSLAETVMDVLQTPLTIDGYKLGTNVSIGIASTSLETICEPNELIRRADIALYDAKQGGRESNVRIFSERMDEWVFERLWIEGDLRQALGNGEFCVHFQPLIDVRTGEPTVVEALLRWNHPERGLLKPGRFLRIAEETGHILEIDRWVMRTACEYVANWNARHPENNPLFLGVNVSTRQFWNAGLAEQVLDTLEETGLDPSLLCIEITESTMMQDAEHAADIVRDLREHGVLFAIDDFGTGYSSLSYLREFPIDVLKIDRAFIGALNQDEQLIRIVRAIVEMARALNLVVVAEGIETEEHFSLVRELECDLAQGYFISEPDSFENIVPRIERRLLTVN